MKSQSSIKERIKKLLALAQSANENEANLAFERAAELMFEHSIDKNDMKENLFDGPIGNEKIDRITAEVLNDFLIVPLCGAFRCQCVSLKKSKQFDIFGTESARETTKAMYEYCLETITRITKNHVATVKLFGIYADRKYINRYRAGIASGMIETLRAIASKYGSDTGNKAVLEYKMKVYKSLRPSRTITSTWGGNGFSSGKDMGQNVGFSKQAKGNSQPNGRLLK